MRNEKEPWYSDLNGRPISKEDFLSLYVRYHASMDDTLNRHFNVRNYYTVLLSALSSVYIGGILQLEINNVSKLSIPYVVLVTLPVVIIVLSVIAIKSTTRYYTPCLRRVALLAKIENILGIDSRVKLEDGKHEKLIWKKDKSFMDNYYVDSRKTCESSDKFIEKNTFKGDNKWAFWTFNTFIGLGSFLLLFHIYILFV